MDFVFVMIDSSEFGKMRMLLTARVILLASIVCMVGCSGDSVTVVEPCRVLEGFDGICPSDMVHVPDTSCCIDRYEASISIEGSAESVEGVLPAVEVSMIEAREACEAAGKQLCPEAIWHAACSLHGTRSYPYGDEYDNEACSSEVTSAAVVETGAYEECEGGILGLFDMSGNVSEWVTLSEQSPFYQGATLGGGFTNSGEQISCQSSSENRESDVLVDSGFRCCRAAEAR